MIIPFGKYRGKSVEWLVLNRPDYVKWVLEQPAPTGPLAALKADALRLVSIFDAKPIVTLCKNCQKTATRFTGYAGNPYMFYAWCETCDCFNTGAVSWKLVITKTYVDTLNFAHLHCEGLRSDYRRAINAIAMAKGFPERSSAARIKQFFKEGVEPYTGKLSPSSLSCGGTRQVKLLDGLVVQFPEERCCACVSEAQMGDEQLVR
jgi:uncharacterized protein (DUF3820 family)